MASTIKMRAKLEEAVVVVKALVSHPMETGLRKDSVTGEKIPAHFITEVIVETMERQVLVAHWGVGISKNPYLSFKYRNGRIGETVKLTWIDNKGNTDSLESEVT